MQNLNVSIYVSMFHLHQVACEGFGFLYVQLELLVDDGHELPVVPHKAVAEVSE